MGKRKKYILKGAFQSISSTSAGTRMYLFDVKPKKKKRGKQKKEEINIIISSF